MTSEGSDSCHHFTSPTTRCVLPLVIASMIASPVRADRKASVNLRGRGSRDVSNESNDIAFLQARGTGRRTRARLRRMVTPTPVRSCIRKPNEAVATVVFATGSSERDIH